MPRMLSNKHPVDRGSLEAFGQVGPDLWSDPVQRMTRLH